MEWYIKKGIKLDLSHFLTRAKDSGDWKEETISEIEFRELLSKKIDTVNMDYVKKDVIRFIKDPAQLDIWSTIYFHDLVANLQIEKNQLD
jgi:hypothetical protein